MTDFDCPDRLDRRVHFAPVALEGEKAAQSGKKVVDEML
jgi:hypothetical protein